MNETAILLAQEVAQSLIASGAGSLVLRTATAPFERILKESFPFLKHMMGLRDEQILHSLEVLSGRVRRIEMTHDGERILGFANMCFRYFDVGAKEHREFKLKLLAAACAHCGAASNVDSFDSQLEFFEAVERLQPLHFSILKYLDEHHSTIDEAGNHHHPITASFDELIEKKIAPPQSPNLWLTQALLALNNFGVIYVKGPGLVMNERGSMSTIVEPTAVIRAGTIGLQSFGCRLLRYVEDAFADQHESSV